MVLFFGEIIPQALCKRFGLAIGANSYWIVRFLQLLLFVIAWPIGKLLDFLLGKDHVTRFKRSELKELVNIHSEDQEGPLTMDESTIIKGALDMKYKTVKHCMTPLDQVFMVSFDARLDRQLMTEISKMGHSRIPIYQGQNTNVKGILLTKSLLFVDMDHAPAISEFELRELPSVPLTADLYGLLNMFQTGRSHMAVVINPETKHAVGIVTLEDIIEELIQEEILDEDDLADVYNKQALELMEKAKKYQKGLRNTTRGSSRKFTPTSSYEKMNNNNSSHNSNLESVELDSFVNDQDQQSFSSLASSLSSTT